MAPSALAAPPAGIGAPDGGAVESPGNCPGDVFAYCDVLYYSCLVFARLLQPPMLAETCEMI